MKKIFLLLAIVLAVTLLIQPLTIAQTKANPSKYNLYYYHTICSARAYTANTTDTLPNTAKNTWGNQTAANKTIIAGATTMASLRITTLDSAYIYVYVDELIGSTYSTILTDSLEQDAAYTQEFPIRAQATEKTAKLGGKYRIRLNFQNVTQGTTTATYTAELLFKP